MNEPVQQEGRALFINDLKMRLFGGLIGFALFYLLDQSVQLFIQWYIGSDSSLVAASHAVHALGELSRVVCGILAMTVVFIALAGIRLPRKKSAAQDGARK